MIRKLRPIALLFALAALVAVPAVSQANHGKHEGRSGAHCTIKRAFVVRGVLNGSFSPSNSRIADDISITVTGANLHARRSGEIADQNASARGVQVKGAHYSLSGDTFRYRLVDFETGETPNNGDRVKLIGKILSTKKRCAAPGTSLADRYGDVNIRRVIVKDSDRD